jgi:hypothetical protein
MTPALAASAKPMATRKGAAVARYAKASGVIADLAMSDLQFLNEDIITLFSLPIY